MVIIVKKVNIYDIARTNIKKYRTQKNLTQAQLADAAGLSHEYVRHIESKKVAKDFSLETLYDIAVALDIKISLLLEEE